MIRSKALKDWGTLKKGKLYSWWIETELASWWYNFSWNYFGKYRNALKKSYQWYRDVFLNKDFDFDATSLYTIMEYKLKRVLRALENGHAHHEEVELQALKLAIKLSCKLAKDDYEMRAWNLLERKWGELLTWTTPYEKDDFKGYEYHSRHENVNTEEEKQQAWDDRMKLYEAMEKIKTRDKRWLYGILEKYLERWWD